MPTKSTGVLVLLLALFMGAGMAQAQVGFPQTGIWLSSTDPKEGDALTIYTVVYNGSAQARSGTLVFMVDGSPLASRDLSLDPGKTELESAEWRAKEGPHSFAASLSGGGASGLGKAETKALVVSVSPAPPPSPLEKTLGAAGHFTSTFASTSAPLIADAARKAYGATEALREAGLSYATRLASSAPAPTARISPSLPSTPNATSTAAQSGWMSKLGQLASPAILFIFGSRAVFYPLLILALLGSLYLLGKRVNRPRF